MFLVGDTGWMRGKVGLSERNCAVAGAPCVPPSLLLPSAGSTGRSLSP